MNYFFIFVLNRLFISLTISWLGLHSYRNPCICKLRKTMCCYWYVLIL